MLYHIYILLIMSSGLSASSENIGIALPLFSIIPFIGILLSIAIIPLVSPIFWHRNYGKISACWALIFFIPFTIWRGVEDSLGQFVHVLFLEYFPFIIILFSLYTISGGIRIKGKLSGSPEINTLLIFIGTILALWMGTTGASMLLIRPILRANKWRNYKVHTVIFFIFLVANIGGSLTPLGDPPLFLGFLNGINFFWTTKAMFFPMSCVVIMLLFVYYLIDLFLYKKENIINYNKSSINEPIGIEGFINIFLLILVLLTVMMSGFWEPRINNLNFLNVQFKIQNILRDLLLITFALISLKLTDSNIRLKNGFSWLPIKEVAKLFAGIFMTIIPAILILQAGERGALGSLISMVSDENGNPINIMYFWLTGMLSAFLDNAPTYLVFFNIAGSSCPEGTIVADYLMNQIPNTLLAISAGSVFMGAMTYIGNAPNFMIQSIAEENNVKMPSFFGYMMWSFLILVPIFFLITTIIF